MRFAAVRGTWSPTVAAAFLVAASACSPQCGPIARSTSTPLAATSSAPSPSPTPTAPLQLAAATFHPGEVGLAYSPVAPTPSGGRAPYAWSIAAGSLPAGLTLGPDGSVSGTPTAAGTYSFTEQVTDAGGTSASQPGTVTVASALVATLLPACSQYCAVELGCVSVCGGFGQLSGGLGPYTYTISSGALPAGTSLSGLALTGKFVGLTGYLTFSVRVSDSLGAEATVTPTFWMYPHVALSGGTIPAGSALCYWPGAGQGNPGCTASFPYSGGTPNAGTPAVFASWASYSQTCSPGPAPCPAPPMPTITVGGGLVTISVPSGTSTWINGYKGTLTVVIKNQDLCSAGPTACSASASIAITQQGG